jgi:hypothetical protein
LRTDAVEGVADAIQVHVLVQSETSVAVAVPTGKPCRAARTCRTGGAVAASRTGRTALTVRTLRAGGTDGTGGSGRTGRAVGAGRASLTAVALRTLRTGRASRTLRSGRASRAGKGARSDVGTQRGYFGAHGAELLLHTLCSASDLRIYHVDRLVDQQGHLIAAQVLVSVQPAVRESLAHA